MRRRVNTTGLLLALLLVACGCGLTLLEASMDRAQAEAFIGAPFPASAAGLTWQVQGFTDILLEAAYSAPAAVAEAHLAALGLLPLAPDAATPGALTARRDDYTVNRFYHVTVVPSADGGTWQVSLRVNSQ